MTEFKIQRGGDGEYRIVKLNVFGPGRDLIYKVGIKDKATALKTVAEFKHEEEIQEFIEDRIVELQLELMCYFDLDAQQAMYKIRTEVV